MPRFHLRFKNFRPAVIEAATDLFEAKPWRQEDAEQLVLGNAFIEKVCAAYDVPKARLCFNEWGSGYQPAIVAVDALDAPLSVEEAIISLHKWSITTLLGCVRGHLLANGITPEGRDPEQDPRSWAFSLFYTVKPAMFRARVREGRIEGETARDTYTQETWAQLVVDGKADNYSGTLIPQDESVSETSVDDDDTADEDEWDGEGFEDETAIRFVNEGDANNDFAFDGLDALGIVALRQLSRGRIQGGYSLSKTALINALRQAGVTA